MIAGMTREPPHHFRRLMCSIVIQHQVLAFMTDTTRVTSFMSRDVSSRVFPESGVKAPFHALSHHGENPETIAEFARLNRYHVNKVALPIDEYLSHA
jgi:hypothetical protein